MASKKKEVSIQDSIIAMESSNQKNRVEGLADHLKDAAYHSIFEAVFKVARLEKQSYLVAKNQTQRTKAENALTTCSDLLRTAIKAGAEKLKNKTVMAVIDHVTQLLPVASGEYCAGLSQFYLKVLGSVLEQETLVEHFDEHDWVSVVEFCLHGIEQYGSEVSGETFTSSRLLPSLVAPASSSGQASSAKLSLRSVSDSGSSAVTKRNSEELLQCLSYLVSASNAPVIDRAEDIVHGILHFLESHGSSLAPFHRDAFSALNSVLSAASLDKTAICQFLAPRLIPIICWLWPLKNLAKDEMQNSVKDEMLISILLLRLHMERIVIDGGNGLERKIEDLERILRTEYAKRGYRDQLQLDEIDMGRLDTQNHTNTDVLIGLLPLKSAAPRAERNWAMLAVMAVLDRLLHINWRPSSAATADGDGEIESSRHPRKRRRIAHRFNGFIGRITSQEVGDQLAAFQTLLFVIPGSKLSQQELSDLLEHLTPCITDRRGNIGSWAMLCIASCASQDVAQSVSSVFEWAKLWHTVSRLITTSVACRAACFLLHSIMASELISYQDIAEDVDSIVTAAEINAPALLSDSSLSLMTHLLNVRNIESPGGSLAASQHTIRWASARWNPTEKSFAARCAIDVHPIDILNLFRVGVGLPILCLSPKGDSPRGTVGHAWIHELRIEDETRYLLLLNNYSERQVICSKCSSKTGLHDHDHLYDNSTRGYSSRRLILDMLMPKFQSLLEEWGTHGTDETARMSTDSLRCAASVSVFGCLLLSLITDTQSRELREELEMVLNKLTDLFLLQLHDGDDTQSLIEAVFQAVQPYLPRIQKAELAHLAGQNRHLLQLFSLVAKRLRHRQLVLEDDLVAGGEDLMELDDMFETQRSRTRSTESKASPIRRDLSSALHPAAFQCTTLMHLILVSALLDGINPVSVIPTDFVEYLVSLQPKETLFGRKMIRDVLESDLSVSSSDALRLITHTGEILSSKKYDYAEVALGLCLDVIISLAPLWANPESGDLLEPATEMYEWFIGTFIPRRRVSPNVQMGLANLLNELMRIQPTYGEAHQLPSVRSSLLDILQRGPILIKFHIAAKLPNLFGLFVLKHHNDILQDVLDSLPSDPGWLEGIAYRLKVLGSLASKWPTLIRLCTFYILEVPAQLPGSVKHATRCLADLSRALDLQDSRKLFQLFASQLLYTWLGSEPLGGIPFEIFGYSSLEELVYDNQEEITALLTMRDQDESVLDVAKLLGLSIEQLLQHCFGKVMAYSIAYDISIPRSSDAKKYVSGETRIRKRLGKEAFFGLVNSHFADIVALFFILIDQEEHIVEKSFAKDPAFLYAANAMNEMQTLSSSEVALPPNQQPAFRAKFLTSEIEHLCGRTEYEVASLYSPPMVVFIARNILNTIHPALGSLHACAALRKLRVLVALCGANALHGYPIEMILQAIRPFISDSECANDSIGLAQYLIDRGSPYLSTSPSFFAGISLTILASLRVFLESSPATTTQQSQYLSTVSKAQSFHTWLGALLAKYEPSGLRRSSAVALRAIMKSAHEFRSEGNADRGSPESDLLMQLLEDERSGRHLLDKPSRNLAFSLLYRDFRQSESFRDDVLGHDLQAVEFAPTLWNLCRDTPVSGSLLVWAGKVLGRAFVATGHVHQQLLQESGLRRIMNIGDYSSRQRSSRSYILRVLRTLTLGDSPQTAGLAEAVLRTIVTRQDMPFDNSEAVLCQESLPSVLYRACDWAPYHLPPSDLLIFQTDPLSDPYRKESLLDPQWPRVLAISLVQSVPSDSLLHALQRLLRDAEGFAEEVFPFVVHLVLSLQLEVQQTAKRQFSKALRLWFESNEVGGRGHMELIMNTLLYLRTQPLPKETSSADRMHWLDVDYVKAAEAAVRCNMFKTALLFVEVSVSEASRTSRRSSASKSTEPYDVLLSILKSIDDPDIFYGLRQSASLSTVLERLEYENDGLKSLAFRGALYDSHLRQRDMSSTSDSPALVNALGMLSLDGLSHSLLQSQQSISMDTPSIKRMFQTARKLEQWDLPIPPNSDSEDVIIYKTFQAINLSESRTAIVKAIEGGLNSTMANLLQATSRAGTMNTSLKSLAALTEADEILSASGSEQFEEMLGRFHGRSNWMKTGKFTDVGHIMSCRETILGCLGQQQRLRGVINVSASDSRLVEVQTSLLSSGLSRAHSQLQESLTSATYLTGLIEPCHILGLNVEAAANLEAANALWEQGEITSSIGMLQALEKNTTLKKQTIPIGRSHLLAKIGYQVSVARLEKPDRIIEKYLLPAIKELKGKADGSEAGQVFHEFAVFCDQQLQDTGGQEDLARLRNLKEMKASEVHDLGKMVKAAISPDLKAKYHSHLVKAKQWLQLDSEEYRRLSSSKDEFLRQSLENYLLSLTASDGHNHDVLRFSALWLEHSEEDLVVESVSKHLENVPTRKFASLMNQLTSRLLDNSDRFQKLLFSLVLRICVDHPYHGMYQIWAGSKSRSNNKDETAVSRQAATNKVAQQIANSSKSAKIWTAINKTSIIYCQLASERDESRYKAGQKIQLKDSQAGTFLNNVLSRYPTPPPTLQVEIALDLDYSKIPTMHKIESQISIASGVSAPKIITVVASDGTKFKQLVKGGNDDLRQDAIMEQVFAQVSELLRTNTATRQRNLGIRTYKVLPLNSNAGIIEFVSNTVPLHEFLMPAHERYYPKDLKGSQCRKQIGEVQTQKLEVRVKTYRNVTEQFHPVMRYFFTEKFHDPDEWFARRLAYTRSTAAISMLGHILGLGDRHGHNILLDETTGEVVHIDLGVAFEMGRVLPVPELVPFRLTRDIVDGMGITKTEGIYRRCCEFTLEALRKESYSIVTILDVLRYDPLYNWSISPVRLAKLQDAQSAAPALNPAIGATGGRIRAKEVVNEPSEADRALTVVKKKLSKTLSVTATVNDLINQASDERNLAVLYSGWAAYA